MPARKQLAHSSSSSGSSSSNGSHTSRRHSIGEKKEEERRYKPILVSTIFGKVSRYKVNRLFYMLNRLFYMLWTLFGKVRECLALLLLEYAC